MNPDQGTPKRSSVTRVVIVVMVVVVIVAVIAAILFIERGTSTPASSTTGTDNSTNQTPQPVQTNAVTINNFAFGPQDITVKAGTTVTWANNDSATHTITSDNDQQNGPNSPDLTTGQSYSFTFTKAGRYSYHCSIHSGMTGTVIVTE